MFDRECRSVNGASFKISNKLDGEHKVSGGKDCNSFKLSIAYVSILGMLRYDSTIVDLIIVQFSFLDN